MISLKQLLLEQQLDLPRPDVNIDSDRLGLNTGAKFQPLQNITRNQDKYVKAALDLTGKTLKDLRALKTKDIASIIWNAKGYVSDKEETAIAAILKIKSVSDFNRVEAHFVRMSDGRTISQYLLSFLEDFRQNYTALSHLYTIGRKNNLFLNAVIYPYASELLFEYKSDIQRTGIDLLKRQGKTWNIKSKYVRSRNHFKWFKPFLGDANFDKWVEVGTDPQSYSNLNPDRAVQLFKYDDAKLLADQSYMLLGIFATIATKNPLPALAVGLFDASDELRVTGDKTSAGMMVAFEALPFVTKLPGVKTLVKRIGNIVATKVSKGVKYLNSQEQYLLKLAQDNQSKINNFTKKINQTLEPLKEKIYIKLDGIEKTSIEKSERMLNQQLKMANDSEQVIKIYQEFVDKVRKIKYQKGYHQKTKLGVASADTGTASVYRDAISKGNKLTTKQKQLIARHEMDHMYSNTAKEGLDWAKAFDQSKWGTTAPYFRGSKGAGSKTTSSTSGFSFDKYNTFDELRARAAQLKDFISMKKGIPLNKDFKISMEDLDYSLNNFVKEVGFDNSMTTFIQSISDKNHLLNLMNKYAL